MLDSRQRGSGSEPHRRHCVMSLGKNINPSLVLVQPRPFITERLLIGCGLSLGSALFAKIKTVFIDRKTGLE